MSLNAPHSRKPAAFCVFEQMWLSVNVPFVWCCGATDIFECLSGAPCFWMPLSMYICSVWMWIILPPVSDLTKETEGRVNNKTEETGIWHLNVKVQQQSLPTTSPECTTANGLQFNLKKIYTSFSNVLKLKNSVWPTAEHRNNNKKNQV